MRKIDPNNLSLLPNTIRTWAIYLNASKQIVAVQDLRPVPGKIDLKPFATVIFEDLTFTRQFYGRYIGGTPYLPGQYVNTDNASWRCIKCTEGVDHFPPYDFNNGIPQYWIRDTTFVDLVPFIRTSNTMIQVYRCHFVGPIHANNLSLPNIDAIHLGGPGGPYQAGGSGDFVTSGQEGISSAGQFMGTGSMVVGCRFYNIRRGIWGRGAANQWTGTGLYFSQGCGDDDSGGAIVLEGTSPLIVAGDANLQSVIVETTFYVHTIRLGFNATGNTVVGANGLDGWTTGLAGASNDTSSSPLPGASGTPTLKVNAAFQDANMCAWKGKQVLLGAHTDGNVTSAITGFGYNNQGTKYAVNDSVTLTAHHGNLTATVTAIDTGGAVAGLLLGAGNNGYSFGETLTQSETSGQGTGLGIAVTAVGASVPELVTVDTTPVSGTRPNAGDTHVQNQVDWARINLDQDLGNVAALIGNGIDDQEITSLTYRGTVVIDGTTYYQYSCLPPLQYIHAAVEVVTVAPFFLPLSTDPTAQPRYPHGGGDSVSRSLSMHHLVQGYTTIDTSGDSTSSSPSYNTIVTSGSNAGSDTVASYQDDNLLPAGGGTTTNTIITSGHRSSPSVLGGSVRVMGTVTTTVISASGNYAVGPQDAVIIMTVANKTVTLPPAAVAGNGRMVTVKNASGVMSTTVRVADGGLIDGNSMVTVGTVNRVLSDGSLWYAA